MNKRGEIMNVSQEKKYLSKASNISFDKDIDVIFVIKELNELNEITIKKNARVRLFVIFKNEEVKLNENKFKLKLNVSQNAIVDVFVSNLLCANINDVYEMNLFEENSEVNFYLSSFVNKDVVNKTQLNINHINKRTRSDVKAYYIIKDKAEGFVRCSSNLENGCSASEAHQELRLTLLDKNAKANSDPILLIKENDIVASHANAIGMVDEEILFYMQTKGLSKDDAISLIVYGYFLKIFKELKEIDEKLFEEMDQLLRGIV